MHGDKDNGINIFTLTVHFYTKYAIWKIFNCLLFQFLSRISYVKWAAVQVTFG